MMLATDDNRTNAPVIEGTMMIPASVGA